MWIRKKVLFIYGVRRSDVTISSHDSYYYFCCCCSFFFFFIYFFSIGLTVMVGRWLDFQAGVKFSRDCVTAVT